MNPAHCRMDRRMPWACCRLGVGLLALALLLSGSTAAADDLLDLRASFAHIPPYTQPASDPVRREFAVPGPGTLRMTTTVSPWYRVGEPVRFRSRVGADGRDEGVWTGGLNGLERLSLVSTPERWVDGAALTIVSEYRARSALQGLEVGLFPSVVRSGDGSLEQLANSVQVTITWTGEAQAPAAADATGLAGIWADPDGPITLQVQGNSVSGSYAFKNGRLRGNLSGSAFSGHWMQDGSALRCEREQGGTFYWGRFELTLDGDRLDGRFGYCEQPLDGSWHWTRSD